MEYLACDADFVIISGNVKWYQSIGDSGSPKKHGFCPECGSTLFGKPQHWPHLFIVYAGSLLKPEEYAPQINIWLDDALDCSSIDRSLKSFKENPNK
ncbi:GFA family protein [Thiotrichales bacterium 19S11-10]|nr:GFA family protein [Thiotrichales bacterium 19S11-10]